MWLLIGLPVAAFMVAFMATRNLNKGMVMISFMVAVAVAVMVAMFSLGGAVVVGELTHSYHFDREVELITLKDAQNNNIDGSFFLGTGSVDSELNFYYVYYYEDEDGSIRLGKANSKYARVYEEDRDTAVVKTYEKTALSKFGLTFRDGRPTRYEIFVPRGTILPGYKLDLE